ncbi:hypothetical protein ACRRTK_004335 [Alexandromys fortis]
MFNTLCWERRLEVSTVTSGDTVSNVTVHWMEETVRSLLQSQGSPEQRREEPAKITAFQERVSEEERKHHEELADLHSAADEDSRSESSSTDEGKENTRLLLKRLKALEHFLAMHGFLTSRPHASVPTALLTTLDKPLTRRHVKIDIPILILTSYSLRFPDSSQEQSQSEDTHEF